MKADTKKQFAWHEQRECCFTKPAIRGRLKPVWYNTLEAALRLRAMVETADGRRLGIIFQNANLAALCQIGHELLTDARKVRLLTSAGLVDAKVVQVDAANDLALLKAVGRCCRAALIFGLRSTALISGAALLRSPTIVKDAVVLVLVY